MVVVGGAEGEAEDGTREAVVASPVGAEAEGEVTVVLGSDAEVWPGVLERRPRPLFFFLGAMREREREREKEAFSFAGGFVDRIILKFLNGTLFFIFW